VYVVLSGCWCAIIVLSVQSPTKDTSNDTKDSFYDEEEQVFGHLTEYHRKILLAALMQNLGERIFLNQ